MPTYAKIPPNIKAIGAIAIGRYAVFCRGIIKASNIARKLDNADKKSGIPAVGYISHKGDKTYYCRYGFVDDPDIYL